MSDQEQDEGGASASTASKRPMMWLRAACQEKDEGGARVALGGEGVSDRE